MNKEISVSVVGSSDHRELILEPGIFTPAPARASVGRLAYVQGKMETKLMLRHGEQQLLNLILPLTILVIASFIPVLGEENGIEAIFPMVLAIASTSAGFTGQAISVAFDRRYGALKRSTASGVPKNTIISGKLLAVAVLAIVQVIILTFAAVILGWRAPALGIALALIILIIAVAAFTSWGLLMGGTMSSEMVLGLANLIWLILLAILGWVVYSGGLTEVSGWTLVPTVAVASGIHTAFEGGIAWIETLVLIMWGVVGTWLAIRFFKFDT